MLSELKKYPMYCGGVKQTYPDVGLGKPLLSRSVVVGNIIFLSGMTGINLNTCEIASDKFEGQLQACLENIRLALEEAGSSMDNLVKNLVLLKNYEDAPRMWKTVLEYYQKYAPGLVEEPPAATVTEVQTLTNTRCLVEVDAIAVVNKNEPGWGVKKCPTYYGGVKQVYPNIKPGMPFMSESVSVGNVIFLSAMSAESPATGKIETSIFEEQWYTILDKVKAAMDRQGSSLSNVIKTLHFLTRVEGLLNPSKDPRRSGSPASDRLWIAELNYYDRHAPFLLEEFPASTFLKVSSLPNSEASGQTEVIGVISKYMPGWRVKNYPLYLARRGFPRHIADSRKWYANSVVVGNLIFLSGAVPNDPITGKFEKDDFEGQMLQAFDNLKEAIEETGSELGNLVKIHWLLPDLENYPKMRELELKYYQKYAPQLIEEPPASTVIHPLRLATPALTIEIDAIAFLPDR